MLRENDHTLSTGGQPDSAGLGHESCCVLKQGIRKGVDVVQHHGRGVSVQFTKQEKKSASPGRK